MTRPKVSDTLNEFSPNIKLNLLNRKSFDNKSIQ